MKMIARYMMGWAVMTLIAGLALAQSEFTRMAEELERSVVRIEVEGTLADGSYEKFVGTGFFAAPGGFLLTAGHVVEPRDGWDRNAGQPSISLEMVNESNQIVDLPGTPVVLYVDEQVDLALLRIEGTSHVPLPLGNSGKLRDRDFIGVLAFGRDRTAPYAGEGVIESVFRPDVQGLSSLVIDNIKQSDSGSPLLNHQGKVVGILLKGWQGLPNSDEVFGVPINFSAPLLSMAGRNHPTTLREWLTDTPAVDDTIRELEEAIRELKTSWTFSPSISRGSGDAGNRLEIVVRKRLEAGYWPESVEILVIPTVRLNSFTTRAEEVHLPPIQDTETFHSSELGEVQLIELNGIEKLVKRRMTDEQLKDFKRIEYLQLRLTAYLELPGGEEIERRYNEVLVYD